MHLGDCHLKHNSSKFLRAFTLNKTSVSKTGKNRDKSDNVSKTANFVTFYLVTGCKHFDFSIYGLNPYLIS